MTDSADFDGRPRRPRSRSYSIVAIGSLANRAALALWDGGESTADNSLVPIMREVRDVFTALADRVEQPFSIDAESDFVSLLHLATYLLDRQQLQGMDLTAFRTAAAEQFRSLAEGASQILSGEASGPTIASLMESFYRLGTVALAEKPSWGSDSGR
jgi:hypothetical protein